MHGISKTSQFIVETISREFRLFGAVKFIIAFVLPYAGNKLAEWYGISPFSTLTCVLVGGAGFTLMLFWKIADRARQIENPILALKIDTSQRYIKVRNEKTKYIQLDVVNESAVTIRNVKARIVKAVMGDKIVLLDYLVYQRLEHSELPICPPLDVHGYGAELLNLGRTGRDNVGVMFELLPSYSRFQAPVEFDLHVSGDNSAVRKYKLLLDIEDMGEQLHPNLVIKEIV